MGLLSFIKKKHLLCKKIGVLDLASSSVGLLVFEETKKNKKVCPGVLFSGRSKFVVSSQVNLNSFLTKIFNSVDNVFSHLEKKELGKIDEIHCFLSSPFFISQTITKTKKSGEEIEITEEFIREFIEEEIGKFAKENSSVYPEVLGDELGILEKKIVDIKLNGYSVTNPYGKKATDIEVSIFVSFGSKKIIAKLERVLSGMVHHKEVFLHTYPVTLFNTTRDIFPEKENLLILDIGGEISDLIIVSDGVLSETVSIPFGENTLIKKIAEIFATSFDEATSTLRLYTNDSLSKNKKEKIKEKVLEVSGEWLGLLKESLRELMDGYFFPEALLLMGDDNDISKIIQDTIDKESLQDVGINSKSFTLTKLDYKMLAGLCSGEESEDIALLLEAVFVQKINK